MGALRALALVALLVVPPVASQLPVGPGALGGPVNEAADAAIPVAENQSGEDLTTESIDLALHLNIVNAEFDLVGVLFGGGKVQTDLDATATLAFHAVNVSRLETALEGTTGPANVTLNGTFGIDSNRTVLTAEEIRAAGGGVLLEAFQGYQEDATQAYIEEAVPQVTVLSTRFDWQNTQPVEDEREDQDVSLRDPPILLEADVTLRFLDRVSLVDLVAANVQGNATENETAEEALQQRIEENQTAPFAEQDAFEVLGIGQLLTMNLPPGWRLNLTVTVPKGFTIAGATDALVVSEDRRTASYYLDGSSRETLRQTSGVVTLSDRFLVLSTLTIGVALVGVLLRFPVEWAAFGLARRRSQAGDELAEHKNRAGDQPDG